LRETFSSHLDDIDRLPDQQGMRGIANRMRARMEERIPPPVRARMERMAAKRAPAPAPAPTTWVENPTTTSET
jgi:hypothetical protein